MKNFAYTRAENVGSAIQSITQIPNAKFLGGGTNLVDLMRENIEQPDHLVDLTALPLAHVDELPGGGMSIGALVTNSHLAAHPLIRARYPVLAEAILHGASGQIRNMATTGGNSCSARAVTTSTIRRAATNAPPAQAVTRLTASIACTPSSARLRPASPPIHQICVALAALDATVQVTGANGKRAIPLVDFHRLPEDTRRRTRTCSLMS